MKTLATLICAATVVASASLQAATITYSSRSAFDTAAGATTLIDFEAQATDGANTEYGSSLTVGAVTITDAADRLFVLNDSVYQTNVGSNFLNNNGGGTVIGLSFAAPVFALGLDWGYVDSWGGGTTIDVLLSTGASFSVGLNQLIESNAGLSFWGVTSDAAITGITINDYTRGLALDDLAYSHSLPAGNSVPDTGATVGMLVVALASILAARRR